MSVLPEMTTPAAEPKSDLVRYCLFQQETDQNHRLAYANSICFCFIVLAIIGLKTPILRWEMPPKPAETVPVIFHPPLEATKPAAPAPDVSQPEISSVTETPQVVPVVTADLSQVAFSVPVEGPVILAPVKFAPPPPQQIAPPREATATPQPVEFNSGAAVGGYYPEPEYPRMALKRRMEGRVLVYVVVDETGSPKEVEMRDSSGWTLLDEHALNWVKQKWQWPAGTTRYYLVPFRFQIK